VKHTFVLPSFDAGAPRCIEKLAQFPSAKSANPSLSSARKGHPATQGHQEKPGNLGQPVRGNQAVDGAFQPAGSLAGTFQCVVLEEPSPLRLTPPKLQIGGVDFMLELVPRGR